MAQSGIVTLLFTDLVNSTEHLERAGDETGQRLFRTHHKLLADAIEVSGGEELQWLGDGVLAAFASAADAVRCAIQIQQTASKPVGKIRFEIRIGIHIGEAMRREDGYFGTAVVAARRLCDQAKAGQILCSTRVAEMLSSRQTFTFKDVGALQLKGLAAPVSTCEVVYERNDPMALLTRTPFVGRAHQIKRLLAKLDLACSGRGAVAMLLGEPGIGKTRTLEEFTDLARERGAMVLRGACYDGEFQPPYGPFAEAIVDYARIASGEDLKAILAESAPTIARIAPALRRYLGDIPEPPALAKEEERFRLLDAVAQSLIALARIAPLVLILDDLHWADRGTVAMLAHVAHFVPSNPILLIGAYRDGEVGRRHPLTNALSAIRRLSEFENIAMKGLEGGEVAELLGMIGDQDVPAALVKAISAETSGNPLFIREVLLHLMEEGKILRDGEGWTSQLNIETLGIPEGVREVISRRVFRLSDEARSLLTVGAAFNGVFSFDVAASVAGLDESTALSAADEALDAQLLRASADSENFDFTHTVIRHTLYSELNPARRVRMHRQIAEAMERQWGERASEHAAEVAYQFWRGAAASGTARGADYAIAAAGNAEKAYAHDELAGFLRIALELLPQNDPRRRDLLVRLGLALTWTLQSEEALKVTRDAAALTAAMDGSSAAADYFETTARAMNAAGLVEGARELAREGLGFIGDRRDVIWASLEELDRMRLEAEDPNNPGIRLDSPGQREWRSLLKRLPFQQLVEHGVEPPFNSREEVLQDANPSPLTLTFVAGEYVRSLPIWEEEAANAERKGRIAWAMSAWANVARCHVSLGNFPAGQAAYDRALSLSARTVGQSLHLLGLFSVKQEMLIALDSGWEELRDDDGAKRLAYEPSGETRWAFAAICSTAAYAFARLGNSELALQFLGQVPPALEVGAPWFPIYGITACNSAYALWLLNRTDYAESLERSLREKVLTVDFRPPMRDSRLSLGRLCALQGRLDEASEWFNKARAVMDEQGARPLRAITDFDEGLMYLRRDASGDAERARPFLTAAADQFVTLGMTGWIQRAKEAISGTA
jgi:class 3 adenylate cyclase/tetratricopeptide (TPR) repeat protein